MYVMRCIENLMSHWPRGSHMKNDDKGMNILNKQE